MSDLDAWGPLGPLAGEWEGDDGLDVSFHNAHGTVAETAFSERTSMKPFGPVENGAQRLYGLDYRTAAWRAGEEHPFHTEVGYWLWDAAEGIVMRCFMVPRGSTILAGASVAPDARQWRMEAKCGSEVFGILSNPFLARAARSTHYQVELAVADDGSWSYDEITTIEHARAAKTVVHTDRNRMRRVAAEG